MFARVWGKGNPPDLRVYWYSFFRGQFDSTYRNSRYTYHLIQQIILLGMHPMEIFALVHKDMCIRYSLQMPKLDIT